jgi:hypothetical protein
MHITTKQIKVVRFSIQLNSRHLPHNLLSVSPSINVNEILINKIQQNPVKLRLANRLH